MSSRALQRTAESIGKAQRVQQHGYLTLEEREQFQRYARQFGLDGSGLAGLLLVRELRVKRLGVIAPPSIDRGGEGLKKVTAHLLNPEFKAAFEDHSRRLGLTPTASATAVFRNELTDKWLECVLDSK